VKEALGKNPNPTPTQIQKIADDAKCSTALVYKWLRKMPEERRMTERPSEPTIRVEEEEEIIEEEEVAEEGEEPTEEFEIPEFEEEEAVTEEEAEEEFEVEPEEEEVLSEIRKRAVKRLFRIAIKEGLQLSDKYGLTDQESEDTEYLGLLLIAKYLKVEVRENILEVTSAMHFGSVALKLVVG